MRHALWFESPVDEHAADIAVLLAEPGNTINLIAHGENGTALGFAEAGLRHDYVNGCETSPVAFLEGIYVVPSARRSGVARHLIEHVEIWARAKGCTEFASDALLDNFDSQAMHGALGFEETERVVYFRKALG